MIQEGSPPRLYTTAEEASRMADRLPRVTAAEVVRKLRRNGWSLSRQSGGHAIYTHPTKPGIVEVPMHSGRTIPLGTIASILAQAGLTPDEFRRL